jgi:hypothetical protein
MNVPLDERLDVVLPILQGLLASGHFTGIDPENDMPYAAYTDHGVDWEKSGFHCRYECCAVTKAMELANDLERELEVNAALRKEIEEESQTETPGSSPSAAPTN